MMAGQAAFEAGDDATALRIWYFEAGLKGELGIDPPPTLDPSREGELEHANEFVGMLIALLADEVPRPRVLDDIADDLVQRAAEAYIEAERAFWWDYYSVFGPSDFPRWEEEVFQETVEALHDACGPDIEVYRRAVRRLPLTWPTKDVGPGWWPIEVGRDQTVAYLLQWFEEESPGGDRLPASDEGPSYLFDGIEEPPRSGDGDPDSDERYFLEQFTANNSPGWPEEDGGDDAEDVLDETASFDACTDDLPSLLDRRRRRPDPPAAPAAPIAFRFRPLVQAVAPRSQAWPDVMVCAICSATTFKSFSPGPCLACDAYRCKACDNCLGACPKTPYMPPKLAKGERPAGGRFYIASPPTVYGIRDGKSDWREQD